MNSAVARRASLGAALALVALALSTAARPQALGSDWTVKNFPLLFDQIFSIRQARGDFIALRAHRGGDSDLPEFSLVLEDTQNAHEMGAMLREAQGSSLYRQLTVLHAAEPAKSAEELKAHLKIRTWTFTIDQCPAIATQFQAFSSIQFVRPRDDDRVDEHPVLYQFHESVGGGDSEVTEYVESRAFPKWANATHQALDACAASLGTDEGTK
jgi:hypothetical protein